MHNNLNSNEKAIIVLVKNCLNIDAALKKDIMKCLVKDRLNNKSVFHVFDFI